MSRPVKIQLAKKINDKFVGKQYFDIRNRGPSLEGIFNRFRNTFFNRLKDKIVFVHVPKCGGVSFNYAI